MMIKNAFMLHTPGLMAKSMFYYVQAVGRCIHEIPCERIGFDSYLIIYTKNGEGLLKFREKSYILTSGQLFIINCMDYQYYGVSGNEPWDIYCIHFNGSESRNYVERILKNIGPVFTINDKNTILKNMKKIIILFEKKDKQLDIKCSYLITGILTELLLISSGTEEKPYDIPEIIQKTIKSMENHYNQAVNLCTICKEVGISKAQLSKLFKKHIGCSPYEYLISYRLNQSKSFLKFTELPVSEIAEKSGFEGVSHFIKMFGKHEGITPMKFRKHLK